MALDERLKEQWLCSLRSGEYRQACGVADAWGTAFRGHRDGTYCCLLVLLDQVGMSKETNVDADGTGCVLPEDACLELGLRSTEVNAFIHANDEDRLTFTEIADRIEDGRLSTDGDGT